MDRYDPYTDKFIRDTISRQQAIDALMSWVEEHKDNAFGRCLFHWTGIKALLENLPSAQPKRGKWILDRSGAYCCSECMEPCATYVMMKPRDKFCKMCGSRNEVTE